MGRGGRGVHDRSQMTLSCLWRVAETRWCLVGGSRNVLEIRAVMPGSCLTMMMMPGGPRKTQHGREMVRLSDHWRMQHGRDMMILIIIIEEEEEEEE